MAIDDDGAAREARAAAITRTVLRLVEAVNRGDQAGAVASFTPDATIVEDVAPYRWQGSDAAAQWMLAMWENAQAMHISEVVMELGTAARIESDASHGYALFGGTLRLGGEGVDLWAEGQLTFSLRASGETWLISALVWSGLAPDN